VKGRAERAGTAQTGEEQAGGDLIKVYGYLEAGCGENSARLMSEERGDRTRGSGHKLTHGRFPLNIRKRFVSP